MQALGITELQYGEMVMEGANRWMVRYFGTEQSIIDSFHHSKSFWKWWVNQWNNRDASFLHENHQILHVTKGELTKWLYAKHQDPDQLKIIPNDSVVKEVGKLLKIENQKLKALKSNG